MSEALKPSPGELKSGKSVSGAGEEAVGFWVRRKGSRPKKDWMEGNWGAMLDGRLWWPEDKGMVGRRWTEACAELSLAG